MAEDVGSDPARLDIVVRGRVQGVGFRFFAQRRATARGLVGWVANGADGSVRCVAEGPVAALEGLIVDLSDGPPGARVDAVEETWSAASGGFAAFDVRAGDHRGD